jgi:hypothetical protein
MLVPFRMVFLEIGEHINTLNVMLFLSVLLGFFTGITLIENKNS